MSFSPELADIRFGCGLSPSVPPPASPQAMLDGLIATDQMAAEFPIEPFSEFRARMVEMTAIRKQMRKTRGTPEFKKARKARNLTQKDARQAMLHWHGQTLSRWIRTDQGFRERLAFFWADHFTARGKAGVLRRATSPYIEDAIRPNMTGRFGDLLIAAVTSPLMLHYLDQGVSFGPNSKLVRERKPNRGLNENLAREVLELHTLGVDGPYTQQDVRQLAELFTGLSYSPKKGFTFRSGIAEPGTETILGKSYGSDAAQLKPVLAALQDLAVHPATARHIAGKMAMHFVSDTPDPALVAHLETRFRETDGDLLAIYQALLEHPSAWNVAQGNVKPPADFVGSACRALDIAPQMFARMSAKNARRLLIQPMQLMGQNWQKPNGPDGWPEEDRAWITPQGVAARLIWSVSVPQVLLKGRGLPDPRAFAEASLGSQLSEPVRFAAKAAESRQEAIGLVLASPAFQRR